MSAERSGNRNGWLVVALLFCVAALNYGDRTAITSVFPLLRRDLGMSDLALGATGTVFLWSYAIFSPLAGIFGDRLPRSRVLTFSLAGWSVVMILCSLVQTSGQLLWLRAALGIAEAAYIPAATALIADYHDSRTRAKAISIHLTGFSFGMVAGGWLSGYLGERLGWRPTFLILGLAGIGLTVVCLLILRDVPAREAERAAEPSGPVVRAFVELARIPSFLVLTAEMMFTGVAVWIFINWLPLYFHETFALSLAMAGLYGTLWYQGGRIAGVLAGGIPSDAAARRNPRYRLLMMGLCYAAAAPLLLTFAFTRSFGLIAAAVFLYNFLIGMGYVNSQPLVCELLAPRLRSTAIGVMNLISCLAGGGGVLVAAWLKSDVGLAWSFASLAVLVLVNVGILVTAYFTCLPRDLARARPACSDADSPTVPA